MFEFHVTFALVDKQPTKQEIVIEFVTPIVGGIVIYMKPFIGISLTVSI